MKPKRFFVSVAGALVLLALGLVPSASAAVNCSFGGSTLAITMGSGDTVSLELDTGGVILVNGSDTSAAPCSLAAAHDTTDTNSITVDGASGDEAVTIDQNGAGGAFPATKTFDVDLAGGTADEFTVLGTTGADSFVVGTTGATIDADASSDVALAGIELVTLAGDTGADTLSGAGGTGLGSAFAGDMTIDGAGGADTLTGGGGDDVINGGADGATEAINGGAGSDTASYVGSAAVDVNLQTGATNGGDAANDTLTSIENLLGSSNVDTLTGDNSANVIDGGAGDVNDTLSGGSGTDTVSYASISAAVTVNLATTSAQDTINAGSDTISGFENLIGGDGNDTLTGDNNANVIEGGAGNDVIAGGSGSDTASYAGASSAVTVNLATTSSQNTGGAGSDTLGAIENLAGGEAGDTLTGDAGNNVITGGPSDDTIVGAAGDDTLAGEGGTDTVSYAGTSAGITVNLTTSTAQNTGGAGTDTLATFENVTGSSFDDVLSGDANANVLLGGDGNDRLAGLAGNDTVTGGNGNDTADYSAAASSVTVNLATSSASGGAGNDTLSSIENAIGSGFNDVLTGSTGDNVLEGGNGTDTVDGGAGTDVASYAGASGAVTVDLSANSSSGAAGVDALVNIEGARGSAFDDMFVGSSSNNAITGGKGSDWLDVTGATGAVSVDLAGGTLTGDGTDTLASIENVLGTGFDDTLLGSGAKNVLSGRGGDDRIGGRAGADTETGGAGNDAIRGAEGNDRLGGGAGNDRLNGGAGNDTCRGGPGKDTIRACER